MGAVWRTECTKWKMSRTRWDLNLKLEKEIQLKRNHRIGMHQKEAEEIELDGIKYTASTFQS